MKVNTNRPCSRWRFARLVSPLLILATLAHAGERQAATHFSPLDQINQTNVAKLQAAWSFHTGNSSSELHTSMECTPLAVGGKLYLTSPTQEVISLDAATGREIWRYDPFPERPNYTRVWTLSAILALVFLAGAYFVVPRLRGRSLKSLAVTPVILLLALQPLRPSLLHRVLRRLAPDPVQEQRLTPNRGLSYWEDGADRRILFAGGRRLIALNADTGKPMAGFGTAGVVDLARGLSRNLDGQSYAVTSPGVIYKNLVVLGSAMSEGPGPVPPGDVRAFDVRNGEQKWTFHTVPYPGEKGSETWPAGASQRVGGVNDWAGMALDEARGLLFLPIGSAAFDYYGGDRTGQNLFSDTLVAVRAETGQLVWHYQMIHHDLWDYDLPCPPTLVTLERGGKPVDALVQPTKQGFLFVLNRETGEPLFPVEERPVPASTVPGERAWPTQPFPLKPAPLSRLAIAESDLTDLSPQAHTKAVARFRELAGASIFTPPNIRGTLVVPGFQGGANWSGASYDPETANLFVNTSETPYLLRVIGTNPAVKPGTGSPYTVENYDQPFLDDEGYPAIKPPWGKLSAINLNTGDTLWQVPLGEYEELTKRGIPVTGTSNVGGSLFTRGRLLFIAATKDSKFRAFDASTGKVLWETPLSAAGHAAPASYAVNGKQYVVVAAGGGSIVESFPSGDEYVAYSLPN